MKFSFNTNFTIPKLSQRSRSILQDGSRSLGLFRKENTLSYNQRNLVYHTDSSKAKRSNSVDPEETAQCELPTPDV